MMNWGLAVTRKGSAVATPGLRIARLSIAQRFSPITIVVYRGTANVDIDLNACLGGEKRAWDEFVRGSAPVIYAAVRRAMMRSGPCSQQDIDDRAQDVYVRLLQHDCKLLRAFDPKRASLSTWLTLIARTVVHEHSQKRRMQ